MTSLLAFLAVFTVAVLVHELGHFIAARRMGIKVYEFSIGFPFSPKVLTLFSHKETAFTLRLLPLGGFVSFSKDGNEDNNPEFLRASRWKRALIASAGSIFNIVFAFLISTIVFSAGKGHGIVDSAFLSLGSIDEAIRGTLQVFSGLLSGSPSMEGLSGPIGIAVIAGKAASSGFINLLYFTGMLSLSLGIFNLLPLPALDGGHLVILAFEAVKGRPLSPKAYGLIGAVGISFFVVLTLIVSYKDILRLVA